MSVPGEARITNAADGYDLLAPHYDAFTAHPNYPTWIRSLEELARRHGLSGRRALDLGCGTGSSLLPLLELGYDAVGCDISPGMLEQAARKLPADARLVLADVCELPELGSFDLVWSVNDGVNYLPDESSLRRAFMQVADCLEPGGIFLFDVNTLHTYATFFATTEVRETDTLLMTWVGTGNESPREGETVETRLEVFELDPDAGLWRRSTSHHRQRHHPPDAIRDALAGAGLRLLAIHGLSEDAAIEDDVDPRHVKAIFTATPESSERR